MMKLGPKPKGGAGLHKRKRLMVQVQFNMAKRDFANGVTGNETIVRRKEVDEEARMVCSVEATVVQVVVEMVVKLCGEKWVLWWFLGERG